MKTIKKSLVILLAILMLATTACGSGKAWAYEANGRQVTTGLYINFIMAAVADMQNEEYNNNIVVQGYTLPKLKDFLKRTNEEGVSYSDLAKQEARKMAAEYLIIEERFEELGLSFTADNEKMVESYVDYFWEPQKEIYEQNGVGRVSVRLHQQNQLKKELVFDALYQEGGLQEVSDEALKELFQKNYAKVEIIYLEVSQGEDGKENAEEKALVEQIFQRYQNGEAIELLDYEYQKATAAEGADASLAMDPLGSNTNIINVTPYDEDGTLSPLVAEIVEAKVGEPVLSSGGSIYYMYTKMDLLSDPEDFLQYRDMLLFEMTGEEFQADLDNRRNGLIMTENTATLKRYTPERISLDK